MLIKRLVQRLTTVSRSLINDIAGATAIEYGLLAALIAVVIVTGVSTIAPKISTTFTTISGKL
jgi:pilus assembly protein Flp/PilA